MDDTHDNNDDVILIHTDGSCLHPQGPGGWAASIRRMHGSTELKKLVISGHVDPTTNVRMEMTAVIKALSRIKRDEKAPIIVRSDNQMISRGMNEWLPGWVAKGWRKADGKAVLNRDLWEDLLRLSDGLNITWEWVKGHSGDPMNEEVDVLAGEAARSNKGPRVPF